MQRARNELVCLVIVVLCTPFVCKCFAQSDAGLPLHSRYDMLNIDSVNLSNLNVHLDIPIFEKNARGYKVVWKLTYDSNQFGLNDSGYPYWQSGAAGVAISYVGQDELPGSVTWETTTNACDPNYPDGPMEYIYDSYRTVDQNNTSHGFGLRTEDDTECGGGATTGTATDDAGDTLTASADGTYTITNSGGLQSTTVNTALPALDTNGNTYSNPPYAKEDSSGATISQTSSSTSSGYTLTETYTDSNGQPENVVETFTNLPMWADMGNGVVETGGAPPQLLTNVLMPDGTSYQLTYEQAPGMPGYTTGRLSSITLPSGGSISYQYLGGNNGFTYDLNAVGTAGLIRTSSDGSRTYSRVITFPPNCANNVCESSEATAQDPQGNQTIADFVAWNGGYSGSPLLETKVRTYQGAQSGGNLLLTKMTCYNGDTGDCTAQAINGATVYEEDVYSTPGGASLSSVTKTKYNNLGLVTEVDEYDAGASTPSRTTRTSYASLGNNIQNRPAEVIIADGNGNTIKDTTYGYDESALVPTSGLPNHYAVSGARGNPTTLHMWSSSSSSVDTTYTYDDAGQVRSKTDPNGTTSYGYDSSGTFVTGVTLPTTPSGVQLSNAATWDVNTGLVTSATDPNGVRTQYSYDSMKRPTEVDVYDASVLVGKTTYGYPTATQVSVNEYQSSSVYSDIEMQYDSYGRVSRVEVANGQSGNPWYQQDTCYDAEDRVGFRSYKYQGAGFIQNSKVCSGNGDTYSYDALGRITEVAHAGGTAVSTTYSGRAVQSSDENNVTRIAQFDALHRLSGVCEISGNGSMPGSGSPAPCGMDISGTGFLTSYSYGPNSVTVTQGGQTRTFETDWLTRPTLTQEPESGQSSYSYSYDPTGLQVIRTRPRANQTNPSVTTNTTTQFDGLGRPLSITYTDGTPSKSFTYDLAQQWGVNLQHPKGHLVAMSTSASTGAIVGYDALGHVNLLDECAPSNCSTGSFQTSYAYDWVGNLLSSSDGFGVTDSYTYSPANELQAITRSPYDATHPRDTVSLVQNGPFGPLSWQLGNGLSGVRQYDGMGRVTGGWVCQGGPTPAQPYCSGGAQVYGFTDGWLGPYMYSACDTALNACSNYQYDEFGRLSASNTSQGNWPSYSYVYDRWGNLSQENLTAGTGPSAQLSFNANNQITNGGFGYDAVGDLISDGAHTYSYDADGNLKSVDNGNTATYSYDALDKRVRIENSGQDTYEYILNPSGQRASIYDPTQGFQLQGQTYWGSTPVEFDYAGSAHYQHQDWTGTERADTTNTGAVEGTYMSLPFGAAYTVSGSDYDPYRFAGMDYDSNTGENGTLHAMFRQYSSDDARWMRPDPYSGSYDFSNPQSLNRYAYVLNNPLSLVDPSGLDGRCIQDKGSTENPNSTPSVPTQQECEAHGGIWIDFTINAWTCDDECQSSNAWAWQEYLLNLRGLLSSNNGSFVPTTMRNGAPNNATPWYKTCSAKAIGSGLLHVGIDAIGLIPEAEGFTKAFENEAGYQLARAVGNSAGYRGVVATQYGMRAVTQFKGGAAAIGGAFGLGDTSVQGRISTGLTVAGFIPGLGTLAAGASIVNDAIKTGMDVYQCP